jgi:N-acyl-D-amino-acid deacylase
MIDTLGAEALARFQKYQATSTEGDTLTIDANGLILCPGFIDMHAHSDLHLLTHPSHIPKLTQGVTTEIVGQDGIAYAPITDATLPRIRKQITGWNGNPENPPPFWDRQD